MENEQKSGLSETLETGRAAAHMVRGAVKAGKAVSGAAKGAAAAGPYGAVAGALWENRRLVGKVIIFVIALLLIPVVFVVSLPAVIFGGLSDAFSSTAFSDAPILNNNAAILENVAEITAAIDGIMAGGLEDTMKQIEADFASSGADEMEVINPYADSPLYNANQFIGMYCAYKNGDYAGISISDMENTLRAGQKPFVLLHAGGRNEDKDRNGLRHREGGLRHGRLAGLYHCL